MSVIAALGPENARQSRWKYVILRDPRSNSMNSTKLKASFNLDILLNTGSELTHEPSLFDVLLLLCLIKQ